MSIENLSVAELSGKTIIVPLKQKPFRGWEQCTDADKSIKVGLSSIGGSKAQYCDPGLDNVSWEQPVWVSPSGASRELLPVIDVEFQNPDHCHWSRTTLYRAENEKPLSPTSTLAVVQAQGGPIPENGSQFSGGDSRVVRFYSTPVAPGEEFLLDWEMFDGSRRSRLWAGKAWFCTCCFTGGRVLEILGDPGTATMRYRVSVMGKTLEIKPTDFTPYNVGDWVFVLKYGQNCANCRRTDPCRDGCEISQDDNLVIAPLRVLDKGGSTSIYAHDYGNNLAALLSACQEVGTIVEIHPETDTATVEIPGASLHTVPIHYYCEDCDTEQPMLGGSRPFAAGDLVLLHRVAGERRVVGFVDDLRPCARGMVLCFMVEKNWSLRAGPQPNPKYDIHEPYPATCYLKPGDPGGGMLSGVWYIGDSEGCAVYPPGTDLSAASWEDVYAFEYVRIKDDGSCTWLTEEEAARSHHIHTPWDIFRNREFMSAKNASACGVEGFVAAGFDALAPLAHKNLRLPDGTLLQVGKNLRGFWAMTGVSRKYAVMESYLAHIHCQETGGDPGIPPSDGYSPMLSNMFNYKYSSYDENGWHDALGDYYSPDPFPYIFGISQTTTDEETGNWTTRNYIIGSLYPPSEYPNSNYAVLHSCEFSSDGSSNALMRQYVNASGVVETIMGFQQFGSFNDEPVASREIPLDPEIFATVYQIPWHDPGEPPTPGYCLVGQQGVYDENDEPINQGQYPANIDPADARRLRFPATADIYDCPSHPREGKISVEVTGAAGTYHVTVRGSDLANGQFGNTPLRCDFDVVDGVLSSLVLDFDDVDLGGATGQTNLLRTWTETHDGKTVQMEYSYQDRPLYQTMYGWQAGYAITPGPEYALSRLEMAKDGDTVTIDHAALLEALRARHGQHCFIGRAVALLAKG